MFLYFLNIFQVCYDEASCGSDWISSSSDVWIAKERRQNGTPSEWTWRGVISFVHRPFHSFIFSNTIIKRSFTTALDYLHSNLNWLNRCSCFNVPQMRHRIHNLIVHFWPNCHRRRVIRNRKPVMGNCCAVNRFHLIRKQRQKPKLKLTHPTCVSHKYPRFSANHRVKVN